METSSESEPSQSKIQAALVFLVHQVIATWIIFFTANSAIGIAADLPRIMGIGIRRSFITSVTRPPYFPAQIVWAFFLGWSLCAFLRHRTMLWVWVVPSVVLGYGCTSSFPTVLFSCPGVLAWTPLLPIPSFLDRTALRDVRVYTNFTSPIPASLGRLFSGRIVGSKDELAVRDTRRR